MGDVGLQGQTSQSDPETRMRNTHAINYPIHRPGVPPISGKVCAFFFFFANVEHPMYPGMCMLDAVGKRP